MGFGFSGAGGGGGLGPTSFEEMAEYWEQCDSEISGVSASGAPGDFVAKAFEQDEISYETQARILNSPNMPASPQYRIRSSVRDIVGSQNISGDTIMGFILSEEIENQNKIVECFQSDRMTTDQVAEGLSKSYSADIAATVFAANIDYRSVAESQTMSPERLDAMYRSGSVSSGQRGLALFESPRYDTDLLSPDIIGDNNSAGWVRTNLDNWHFQERFDRHAEVFNHPDFQPSQFREVFIGSHSDFNSLTSSSSNGYTYRANLYPRINNQSDIIEQRGLLQIHNANSNSSIDWIPDFDVFGGNSNITHLLGEDFSDFYYAAVDTDTLNIITSPTTISTGTNLSYVSTFDGDSDMIHSVSGDYNTYSRIDVQAQDDLRGTGIPYVSNAINPAVGFGGGELWFYHRGEERFTKRDQNHTVANDGDEQLRVLDEVAYSFNSSVDEIVIDDTGSYLYVHHGSDEVSIHDISNSMNEINRTDMEFSPNALGEVLPSGSSEVTIVSEAHRTDGADNTVISADMMV